MSARTQSEHEALNRREYPGTRQLCVWCDEPTERCEDDSIYLDDGRGPLCPSCLHKWEVARINKAHSTCKLLNDLHERVTKLECAIPADMDANGLAEAHGKLNPELGMPESRGNVETGTIQACPCPACGKTMAGLWDMGGLFCAGYEFHCDHCNARLRVEYATVTLSEEAGRRQ